jgi:hypothetical protein
MSVNGKRLHVNGLWLACADLSRDKRTQLAGDLVNGDIVIIHMTPRQAAAITGVAEKEVRTAAAQLLQSKVP